MMGFLALAVALPWLGPAPARAEEATGAPAATEVLSFGEWELDRSDDEAKDLRRCHVEQGFILVVGVRRADGTGFAQRRHDGGGAVAWERGHLPGRRQPGALESAGDAGRSAEVISGMLSGKEIEARYIALEVSPGKLFPNRLPRTARASLAGFAEAHAEMRRLLDAYGGG